MRGGAGEWVPVTVSIVSSEELIEGGSYVGHWKVFAVMPTFIALDFKFLALVDVYHGRCKYKSEANSISSLVGLSAGIN